MGILENKQFLERIRADLTEGYCLTPFLGSGISAPSGILMGQDFANFLAYSVYMVIEKSWDIRRKGWPPYPAPDKVQDAKQKLRNTYERLIQRYQCEIQAESGLISSVQVVGESLTHQWPLTPQSEHFRRPLVPPILATWEWIRAESYLHQLRRKAGISDYSDDPNFSKSSREYIRELAMRALWHWTSTLEFLASVAVNSELGQDEDGNKPLYMTAPESFVIDSFNFHITNKKRPSLIHNMIARLSRSLCTQVVLTTNFDNLLEQSFSQLAEPIRTIPVSTKGGLPPFSTVRSQVTLVKLHGDLLETRADQSIADEPTRSDRHRFFSFLRGPEKSHRPQPEDFVPSQLLVIGYSANDARCVQMIKHVLDYDRDFRVYWVCYSRRDASWIEELFREYRKPNQPAQVLITVCERPDLLLWELYQAVNCSLPGGGFSFQFSHDVPPLPLSADSGLSEGTICQSLLRFGELMGIPRGRLGACEGRRQLAHAVQAWLAAANQPCVISSESGVSELARVLYAELRNLNQQVIWFELEDYQNPLHVVFHVFQVISIRAGKFQLDWCPIIPPDLWENAYLETAGKNQEAELHLKSLCDYLGINLRNYTLFLYGRNGAGGCVGMDLTYWQDGGKAGRVPVAQFLQELGFRVIHMPFDELRQVRNMQKCVYVDRVDREKRKATKTLTNWRKVQYRHLLAEDGDAGTMYDSVRDKMPQNSETNGGQVAESQPIGPNPVMVPFFEDWGDEGCGDQVDIDHGKRFERMIERSLEFVGGNKVAEGEHDEAKLGSDHTACRTTWLYSLTLFRKSRHAAAMISEAVFSCPNQFVGPFNFKGSEGMEGDAIDNDAIRWRLAFGRGMDAKYDGQANSPGLDRPKPDEGGWVGVLSEPEFGILLSKPGGYKWKFRDARLGLQYILEGRNPGSMSPSGLGPERIDASEDMVACPELWQSRPRIHFWIADWYVRSYYATGHYSPLMEAFYHSYECLRNARNYVPSTWAINGKEDTGELKMARVRLAWRAVQQLLSIIEIAAPCLRFWCPGMDIGKTFFCAGIKRGGQQIFLAESEQLNGDGEGGVGEYYNGLKADDDAVRNMSQRLLAALGTVPDALKQLRKCVMDEARSAPTHPMGLGISYPAALGHGRGTDEVDLDWQRSLVQAGTGGKKRISMAGSVHTETMFILELAKELDVVVENGDTSTIGIDQSEWEPSAEFRPQEYASHATSWCVKLCGTAKRGAVARWLEVGESSNCSDADDGLLSFIGRLLDLAYLLVRRAKYYEHCGGHPFQFDEQGAQDQGRQGSQVEKRLHQASAIWIRCTGICFCALDLCRYLPASHLARTTTLRIRALTIYGVSLGRLTRFQEAHRRLNEAHALIARGRGLVDNDELAKVRLRRAEVELREAVHYRNRAGGDQAGDRQLTIRKIDGAWASLERAEEVLSGFSHSNILWARLLSLKLQCYAMLASLKQRDWRLWENLPRPSTRKSCLPFRNRVDLTAVLSEMFKRLQLLAENDEYMKLAGYLYAKVGLGLERSDAADPGVRENPAIGSMPKTGATVKEFRDRVSEILKSMDVKDSS